MARSRGLKSAGGESRGGTPVTDGKAADGLGMVAADEGAENAVPTRVVG
jgi:hypothetical protein